MKATTWLFLVLGVAVIAQPVLADHKYGKTINQIFKLATK